MTSLIYRIGLNLLPPYKQFSSVSGFNVYLLSDLVNDLGCKGATKLSDHSELTWTIHVNGHVRHKQERGSNLGKISFTYNTSGVPMT